MEELELITYKDIIMKGGAAVAPVRVDIRARTNVVNDYEIKSGNNMYLNETLFQILEIPLHFG